ncbi:MAG: corrinoid methyltransferase [Bacteroidia bacterium]|nr:MAG: corrinoid methyltransferase [Bacteroidia bacterium]
MDRYAEIAQHVQNGYSERARKAVEAALAEGCPAERVLKEGLIAGMEVVAAKFKSGQMFLPEVLAVAGAMKAGMELVKPLLVAARHEPLGKVVLGTVRGDMHDIGKNLVAIMLQGAGFDVVDLGTDVRVEKFIDAIEREHPDVVGMSALLTTTMVHMKTVIEALKQRDLRAHVKVIVGGAPISKNFASEIGADGYARDAATAVDVVKELLNSR